MTTKIQVTLTVEQAAAACEALDAYSRLCIGQLQEVANMVSYGVIPVALPSNCGERTIASTDICSEIDTLMRKAKCLLGHPSNGNHGIHHPHIAMSGRRSYEVKKTIEKTLAILQNPNPDFMGVKYDGLSVRVTTDLAPTALVIEE